jgi:hypothetical protein
MTLMASSTLEALQVVAAIGAVLAAVAIPLTAYARRPRLSIGPRADVRLAGGVYLGLPEQELRAYLTVMNERYRRAAQGARVVVDSVWPAANPSDRHDLSHPELLWANANPRSNEAILFPGGSQTVELGRPLALVRNAPGRIAPNDGRTDWPTMLERGGHWEFQLSLNLPPAVDDPRAYLSPRDGGYIVRLVVDADDAAAQHYDIEIDWDENAKDIIDAQDSVRIRVRRTATRGWEWGRRSYLLGAVVLAALIVGGLVGFLVGRATDGRHGRPEEGPYNRNCGTSRDGGLTANERWETIGPWHVSMSYATARSIAERVGPNEFQPSGSHPLPKEVPCVVASSVAFAAANRWSIRHGTYEEVSPKWTGYASGPSLGRFRCFVTSRRAAAVRQSCIHAADRHAGRISVDLTIRSARGRP